MRTKARCCGGAFLEPQGSFEPRAVTVVEIDVEEGTSLERLQEVLDEFLKSHGRPGSSQKS